MWDLDPRPQQCQGSRFFFKSELLSLKKSLVLSYSPVILSENEIRLSVTLLMTRGEQEEENVSMVKRLYDAFKRHEVDSIMDMFADDVVMHGPAPSGVLPWGGTYNGHSGVAQFFKALGESLEPQQFDLNEFITQENKVVVFGYQRGRAKPTGLPYETEFVNVWTIRNGKFTEFRVYNDTASLVESLRS
jgi:ketosteroid isomerase-like protein